MNIPLRLLLCLLVVEVAYGGVLSYAPYILVFATVIDLEHLPQLFKGRGSASPGRNAWAVRSRFHELYGLILLSSGIAICALFYRGVVIEVIALSTLLHAATDFLLGRTRPLYPFSDREVFLRHSVSSRRGDAAHVHYNKLGLVRRVRGVIDQVILWLPLPRMNPNHISGLTIITSLLFVLMLRYSYAAAIALAAITVLLDWVDGVIAQKHSLCSEEGYVVDVASDRLSEGIMFVPFFLPWFYLFLLNSFLTLFSFSGKRHVVLPLRQVFLIVFAFFGSTPAV